MSGCVKALIIVGVLLVVLVLVVGIALQAFLSSFFGADLGRSLIDGSDGVGDCRFLPDEEARAVLGGSADAIELTGFFDASIGLIIDKRVLADAEDCWVTEGARTYIARVARHDGPDAASRFAAERAAAQPTSDDQGGGVSVTTEGYDAGDAPGIGDEAFCTGLSNAIMAGVLVRQGNSLVYVSVGPEGEGSQSVPDMQAMPNGVIGSPGLCALAQELAREVLD